MDLRDAQWTILEPFFKPKPKLEKRGRPPQDARAVLNGVLWILRTGAPERHLSNFLGMVHLGCAAILLRYF